MVGISARSDSRCFPSRCAIEKGHFNSKRSGSNECCRSTSGRGESGYDSDSGIKVTRISDQVAGPQIRQELLLLGGAVFCVLLVACSNIASLQVARNSSRRRELAIRQALGASRATLLWHLTRENILIVFVSTLGAFLFAYVSLRMLVSFVPIDKPRVDQIRIDGTVILYTCAMSLVALTFSLIPSSRILREDLTDFLHEGGRGQSADRSVK